MYDPKGVNGLSLSDNQEAGLSHLANTTLDLMGEPTDSAYQDSVIRT